MNWQDDVNDILDGFDFDPDEGNDLDCTCVLGPDDCDDENCECFICHAYPYAD